MFFVVVFFFVKDLNFTTIARMSYSRVYKTADKYLTGEKGSKILFIILKLTSHTLEFELLVQLQVD